MTYTTQPMAILAPNYPTLRKQVQRQRLHEELGTDVDTLAGLALVLFHSDAKTDPGAPTEKNPIIR